MKASCVHLILSFVIAILTCGIVALADEVETKSGQTVQGLVRSGIPLTITIEESGFIIHINRSKIREIKRGAGVDVGPPILDEIVTIEGEVFRGTITTAMPAALLLQTKSGFAQIKYENIRRVYFETTQSAEAESASSWGIAFNPSVLVGINTSSPAWTVMYGIAASKDFASFLSVKGEIGYATNTFDLSVGRITLNLFLAEGSAIFRLPLEGFTPCVSVGVALVQLNLAIDDQQQGFLLNYYSVALGAEMQLWESFSTSISLTLPYFHSIGAVTSPIPVIMLSVGIGFRL